MSDEVKAYNTEDNNGNDENHETYDLLYNISAKKKVKPPYKDDDSDSPPGPKSPHNDRKDKDSPPSHRKDRGAVVSPYPPPNGALSVMSMGGGRVPPMITHSTSPLPFMLYNPEAHHPAFQPPPAHMGIHRPPMYPLPGQYSHAFFSEYHQFQWHSPMYPMSSNGFRGPFGSTLPVSSAGLSNLARFSSPGPFIPPHLIPHPPSLPQTSPIMGPKISILSNVPSTSSHNSNRMQSYNGSSPRMEAKHDINGDANKKQRKPTHIKKPLNAFMLYMKEMRAKVVAECTLKESAAINQILGRRWHALDRAEQSKYYDLAKKERQLHMELYPGWTPKDNYLSVNKKKKRKKDKSIDGNNPKKCRARFGLDQQESWCKPCRRKKKCIRYTGNYEGNESEDIGSAAGSIGEPPTPDSFIDSDQETIRSNNPDLHSIASPSNVPINLDTPSSSSSSSSSVSSRSGTNGTLNPHDINNPLSVSQLTQSHHSSNSHFNPLSPMSIPSPMTDPPSVTSAPPMLSVT